MPPNPFVVMLIQIRWIIIGKHAGGIPKSRMAFLLYDFCTPEALPQMPPSISGGIMLSHRDAIDAMVAHKSIILNYKSIKINILSININIRLKIVN